MEDIAELDPLSSAHNVDTDLNGATPSSMDGVIIPKGNRVAGQLFIAVEPVTIGSHVPRCAQVKIPQGDMWICRDKRKLSLSDHECHSVRQVSRPSHFNLIGNIGLLSIGQSASANCTRVPWPSTVLTERVVTLLKQQFQ